MISFIIPVLNEAKFIEQTFKTINKSIRLAKNIKKFEIIVVDDGSQDGIKDKISVLKSRYRNIVFVQNNKNMGMGFSIKKGINLSKFKKFMIIPGGNDIGHESIYSSLKFYSHADLVMQCPLNVEEREKYRNIISRTYSLIYIIFFDCNVYYINGASIFPLKKVKELNLKSNRHGIFSEIIAKLFRKNITYCEIPVNYKWPHKSRTTINLKNIIDVLKSFLLLFIELRIFDKKPIKAKRKKIIF
jgi:glycosyltransferase involved in cell wall biosynthesis